MLMDYLGLLIPLFLHMVISESCAALLGTKLDAAACTTAAAIFVIIPAYLMYRKEPKEQLSDTIGQRILPGVFCLIGGGVLNYVWSSILTWLQVTGMFSNQTQEELLASQLILQVIGLGILVPLGEELVFRGLIYTRMKRLFPVPAAVLFSALLFSVYHGNPIQIIFAFPMSVALAVIYEKGKWFGYPLLFHIGANLTAVIVNVLSASGGH